MKQEKSHNVEAWPGRVSGFSKIPVQMLTTSKNTLKDMKRVPVCSGIEKGRCVFIERVICHS